MLRWRSQPIGGSLVPVFRTAPPARPTPAPSFRGAPDEGVVEAAPPSTDVFAASWCCSVGATWTVELRSVDGATKGRPAEWICSGVPTQQPAPDRQTGDLFRERGLLLFPVDPVDPAESPPRTRSRRLIGYVTRNPELVQLALMLTKVLDAGCDHPMIVAARWMQDGYSADTAYRWFASSASMPEVPHVEQDAPATPPN